MLVRKHIAIEFLVVGMLLFTELWGFSKFSIRVSNQKIMRIKKLKKKLFNFEAKIKNVLVVAG